MFNRLLPNSAVLVCCAFFCVTSAHSDDEIEFRKLPTDKISDWDVQPDEAKWWRVEDHMVVGGSLDEMVPYNTFAATKDEYKNFELRLKIRIQGTEGFVNSGIQIRSVRVPKSTEMQGYQVDAGDGWWGKLYDESRRNKVISESKELKRVEQSIKPQEWNEMRIIATGPRIQSWINDVPALDYVEADDKIPLEGKIGFQVHGGGKALVQFKDIEIRRLP